ncbi:MAG: hypothetical protein H5T76_01140 [Streptomyces sp.]|nr:hypothetical protein [Streptomyces sp.]
MAAALTGAHLRDNRFWDDQGDATQTHGLWITPDGGWHGGRVSGNDFGADPAAATRFDTPPDDLDRWHDNDP